MQKQKIRFTLLFIIFLYVTGVCSLVLIVTQSTRTSAVTGYQLIWSDEFSGNNLDSSKWGYQLGSWSGSSVQNCYTENNVSVAGGSLRIAALYEPSYACYSQTRDFTSGFVQTKGLASWTYGYFEARIKMPRSSSTWPAFWMSPQNASYGSWPRSGEIDIMEARGHDHTQINATAHWGESSTNKQQQAASTSVASIEDWHTYAVEWSEGVLKYYLDGVHFHTINNFTSPNATVHPGPFNIPYYLRLNMAVGGTYLSAPYNDANSSIAELPAVMEVDYVRVYEKETFIPTPISNQEDSPSPTVTANESSMQELDVSSSGQSDSSLTDQTSASVSDNERKSSEVNESPKDMTQEANQSKVEEVVEKTASDKPTTFIQKILILCGVGVSVIATYVTTKFVKK